MKVTVLGSGTSHGVPSIGCDCAVCRSTDPRDQRTRPSILIELSCEGSDSLDAGDKLDEATPDTNGHEDAAAASAFARAVRAVLVDTSTDLRMQALANNVRRVDAILFTHTHADHIFGLDDVRRYNQMQQGPIACFADAQTVADLRRIFAYVFEPPRQKGGGLPQLSLFRIEGPFVLGGVEIIPVPLLHGAIPVLGFRLGAFAYLTDCNRIPDASWPLLEGVRILILDALRRRPHSTHFSVDEAVAVALRLGAEQTYFTHICHDLPHAATNAQLPQGIELAYDGLVLNVL
jgi:phosphoribosyl 1,2-cyclic phosphate phosphodiesterase